METPFPIVENTVTARRDLWWLEPLLMLIGGTSAIGYLTWAAFQGNFYEWGPYLSPVYSAPYIPDWWKLSPALLLLWIPGGFRVTCYYARKAYYRAVFADPAACAVGEPHRSKYSGESKFPFILQNLHRYFLYLALGLVVLHWTEWILSIFFNNQIYLGLGTFLILIDTLALTFYVFGCHALRHLVGGKKRSLNGCCQSSGNQTSCKKSPRYRTWKAVTLFNERHNLWFWASLFSIIVADLYIRLLAMNIIPFDPHLTF